MVLPTLKTHKVGINKNINIQYYEKFTVKESGINGFKVNWTKSTAGKSDPSSLQVNEQTKSNLEIPLYYN